MTAAKKKAALTPSRYQRRDQSVLVLEAREVLDHDGEMPAGVTKNEDGTNLLFQGVPIVDGAFLVFDELGNPLDLWAASDFKETYDPAFEGYQSATELKGELAQAKTMIVKLTDEMKQHDGRVDRLRSLVEDVAKALGLDIGAFENEEAFVQAVTEKTAAIQTAGVAHGKSTDSALQLVRDILRIEPAQNRDDGGRIIHLTKKHIDRAVALV